MNGKSYLAGGIALALSAGSAQAGDVRITVAEYSSKTGPYFQKMAEEFEAANPDINIEVEVTPWDVLLQKLTTDIAGNANADLAIIGTRWLLDFVEQDIAEPLDSYIDDAFRGRFIETFLSPSVMDGKVYGLPVAASARAMYYNKSLFEQAGIDAPPETWEELKEDARAISDLGEDIAGYGLQGKEIETDVYFYYPMWSYGGNILNEDGSSGFGSDAAIQAATLYKSLIDEGLTQDGPTAYSREDVQNLFKQGKVGMMITAPFLSGQIKQEAPDLQYGIAPIPAGPGGDRGTYGVTDSIIMFSNSDNKDEAWQFLDYLFTQGPRSEFTRGEGFLPVNNAVSEEPAFTEDADLKAFAAILPDARFAPVVGGWEEIADVASSALQRVYLGEATPEEAMGRAAEEANRILGK